MSIYNGMKCKFCQREMKNIGGNVNYSNMIHYICDNPNCRSHYYTQEFNKYRCFWWTLDVWDKWINSPEDMTSIEFITANPKYFKVD